MRCNSLSSVTIGHSVAYIGFQAFEGCTALTSLEIPNSVTNIDQNAFSSCINLESVTIPNSVQNIGSWAFHACGLTSVTIPNSVTRICYQTFSNCENLTSVTIPDSITNIEAFAFYGCDNLEKVIALPVTPPAMDGSAFSNYNIPLYVKNKAISAYKETEPWSLFSSIEKIKDKCATPTIDFVDGKLTFSCKTPGVEYVYDIKSTDMKTGSGNNISLTGVYTVNVHATKTGFDDSDTATAEILMSGDSVVRIIGDINNDGIVDVADIASIISIMAGELP